MPSPFAHTTAGYIIYRYYKRMLPGEQARFINLPIQLLIIAAISLLPDMDTLPGLILGDMERFHNNASHSLFVGLLAALILSVLFSRVYKSPMKVWFTVALISYELHVLMDYFTGGRGVMLFWPFTSARFNSPIELFFGVQWGLGYLSIWHLWTILTEAIFFLFIFVFIKLWQKYTVKTIAPDQNQDQELPG